MSTVTNQALSDSTNATTGTPAGPGIGQKRVHEEEPVTASGRAKHWKLTSEHRQKPDPLVAEARHVGRTMDAFLTPGAMFNTGLSYDPEDEENADDGPSPEQKRYLNIYKHLCSKLSHFKNRLADADTATFREMEKDASFKDGLSGARSDDIASLKGIVIDWLSSAPYLASNTNHPLHRNTKSTRGFNNPVIGALLCPTNLDWDDPAIQQGLRSGTIDVHPSRWPRFVYQSGQPPADGEDMWAGLFRHPLLVKTLKHIYTSPSSVDGADGSRATRASKGALAGMTSLTPAAIADAVVKLRHSLSSQTTFQKNDKTTHNQLFYYGLLEILEADQAQDQVRDLLQWYNRQLFPGQEATMDPAPNSALAKMRARLGLA